MGLILSSHARCRAHCHKYLQIKQAFKKREENAANPSVTIIYAARPIDVDIWDAALRDNQIKKFIYIQAQRWLHLAK